MTDAKHRKDMFTETKPPSMELALLMYLVWSAGGEIRIPIRALQQFEFDGQTLVLDGREEGDEFVLRSTQSPGGGH